MALSAAYLDYLLVEVCNFDGQTLPEEVPVSELSQLATTPSVNVTFLAQRDGVTFSALNVDNVYVFELRYRPDLVLVQDVAVAKLATVTSAPREHHALVVDGCSVVIAKSKLDDCVFFEVLQLSRYWLSSDVNIA